MKYNIHLNVYDGPLDLLCDLISKQKIDIKDISISEITSQYLAYIDMLNEMDLEVASEFIIMASKLVEIKSKYLLYKQHHEEHEEDPRLELVDQLEEYKKFKEASLSLKENVHYTCDTFFRAKEEVVVDNKIDFPSFFNSFITTIAETMEISCSYEFPPNKTAVNFLFIFIS